MSLFTTLPEVIYLMFMKYRWYFTHSHSYLNRLNILVHNYSTNQENLNARSNGSLVFHT